MAGKGRSNELSSFMQTLDAELMCGICLEFFESPIMLPCGHNFCRKCIHSLIDSGRSFSFLAIGPPTSFNCPVCQKDINMSNYGIDNLPINKPLESIIAMYQSFSPVDIFDMAWNRDLNISISTCPDHKHPMNKYCESCSISVCKSCEKESHRSRHRVTSLIGVASTLQADIADTLTELKRKTIPVYERIELLDDMLKAIDKEEENIKRCLTHNMEALKSSIRAKQEELSDTAHNKMYEAAVPINDQLKRCKMYRTQIQEMMKKLSAIRKTKDVNQRIKLMKDNILQLNIMLQDDFEWLSENMVPMYGLPDMKIDTQDITANIAGLQWTQKEQRKKIFTSKCTQTDNKEIQTDLDSGSPCLHPNEAGNHVTETNNATNNPPDNGDITDTIPDTNHTNVDDTAANSATPSDITRENGTEVNTEVITMVTDTESRSGKTRSDDGTVSDAGSKSEVGTRDLNHKPETLLVDEEVDSISTDMLNHSAPSKTTKSTSRRSFPFDSRSARHEGSAFQSTSPRNIRHNELANGKLRTPPKDQTSEALATFVARRRTLSPYPSDKSRPRVSTSPLTQGNDAVVMETRRGSFVTKDTNIREDTAPERALSPKNYSKEPIFVKLDFETDV